jgi:mannose-6-phosphate isomerase
MDAPAWYPLPLEPRFLEKVWGGRALETMLGKAVPQGKRIGESWELADVGETVSIVRSGPLAGKNIGELARQYPEAILGRLAEDFAEKRFPLLCKFIDASADLSVQVHPSAKAAARIGGGARSKAEGWYVVSAAPEARLVIGLKEGTTRREFERLLGDDRLEKCLHSMPVKTGDAVFLPPGTVHAICAGVLLYEVQEPSDTTFRVYDYNRAGLDGRPRDLHTAEALDAIEFDAPPVDLSAPQPVGENPMRTRLIECDKFVLEALDVQSEFAWPYAEDAPLAVSSVSAEGVFTGGFGEVRVSKGETFLLPAALGGYLEFRSIRPGRLLVSIPEK